jgi:hypothetical protein
MDEDTIKRMIDEKVTEAMGFATIKRGDTPTDVNQLVPKGYVDNFLTTKLYSGRVDPSGTAVYLPTGWASSQTATGQYQITNTITDSDYRVVVTVLGLSTRACTANNIASGSFQVNIGNATNTGGENLSFNFIVMRTL